MGQHSLETITNGSLNLLNLGLKIIQRVKRMLSVLRSLPQEITFQLLTNGYFYKQKEMVIAGVIMECISETDIITQWIRHWINQNFRKRQIWHVASRALMSIVPSQCEWLTSIIVNNTFSYRHLREGPFSFYWLPFPCSWVSASSLQIELKILI